jgi:PAS domain S-box-containing protein
MFGRSARQEVSLTQEIGSAIFTHGPDPIHVIKDGVFVECNPAFERILGYGRGDILGRGPELISPERQPSGETSEALAGNYIGQALRNGFHKFDWVHLRADRTPITVRATLLPVRIQGEDYVLCLLQDQSGLTKVIDTISTGLGALAEGDLSLSLTDTLPEEYEPLRHQYNQASAHLSQLIGHTKDSAETVKSGAQEIAAAAENLARRTEANAASLEQTSAALTQIDSRLKNTAMAAGETAERADQAIGVVSNGRSVATNAVGVMERVAESAKGIDTVIEGLDKIAFQTRVLAMNAAVEAGRAGEAGRGFAVVADLVSALAMRSEEEAKRAKEQLSATQNEVGMAVAAVHDVEGALDAISSNVSGVQALIQQIATDNRSQSLAISEVGSAIAEMDIATQQNAAMVEQTSAATRNLTSEIDSLAADAAQFKVAGAPKARAHGRGALAAMALH